MKKTLLYSVALLALWATFEALVWVGLASVERLRGIQYDPVALSLSAEARRSIRNMLDGRSSYYGHDPLLGWSVQPDGVSGTSRSNSAGIRADREFSPTPPDGVIRIATFGDSFTHGNEVPIESTFQEVLMSERPDLEVLNFGVAGYGLDQALLRYKRDGVPFNLDIVIIGFYSENIFRSVNSFRPHYTRFGPPLAKPRFALMDSELVLIENPLPRLEDYERLLQDERTELRRIGQADFFFLTRPREGFLDFLPSVRIIKLVISEFTLEHRKARVLQDERYNTSSLAFQVTLGVFDEFYRAAEQDGSIPVIVLLPSRGELTRDARRYRPLLDVFRSKGYRYCDLFDAFRQAAGDSDTSLFMPRHHYSPAGHRIVAETILDCLESAGLLTPSLPNDGP